jgi:hypothetical protein
MTFSSSVILRQKRCVYLADFFRVVFLVLENISVFAPVLYHLLGSDPTSTILPPPSHEDAVIAQIMVRRSYRTGG